MIELPKELKPMSQYFDGFFACKLKSDTPQEIIDVLRYMTRKQNYEFKNPPAHRLFEIEGWEHFLQISPSDFRCAPGMTGSELRKETDHYVSGKEVEYYTISFRRTMHDDVEFFIYWWEFIDWIIPYSDTEGFVGYWREEFDTHPELIYIEKGRLRSRKVVSDSGNASTSTAEQPF
jgi:hypothetical protein